MLKCLINPECGVSSCCHCYYLNVTQSPLPMCVWHTQGIRHQGNLSPAHSSSWKVQVSSSELLLIHPGAKCPMFPIEAMQHYSYCHFYKLCNYKEKVKQKWMLSSSLNDFREISTHLFLSSPNMFCKIIPILPSYVH